MPETLTEEEKLQLYGWAADYKPSENPEWVIEAFDPLYDEWPQKGSRAQLILRRANTEDCFACVVKVYYTGEPAEFATLRPVKKVAYTTYQWVAR